MLFVIGLGACTGNSGPLGGGEPESPSTAPAEAPPPPPPQPPPVDIAGRWQLAAAAGGACFMTLSADPGAVQGKIAPEGGCPGNFFTSRKWTFEQGSLIIRDFKGQPLAQLSYSNNHFEGQDKSGGALTLSK
jgi:hypothetical protein